MISLKCQIRYQSFLLLYQAVLHFKPVSGNFPITLILCNFSSRISCFRLVLNKKGTITQAYHIMRILNKNKSAFIPSFHVFKCPKISFGPFNVYCQNNVDVCTSCICKVLDKLFTTNTKWIGKGTPNTYMSPKHNDYLLVCLSRWYPTWLVYASMNNKDWGNKVSYREQMKYLLIGQHCIGYLQYGNQNIQLKPTK